MAFKLVLLACLYVHVVYSKTIFDINSGTPLIYANSDDDSILQQLSKSFPYFGNEKNTIYISANGLVSFDAKITEFDTSIFPLQIGTDSVFPFFADSNGFNVGSVRHREAQAFELTSLKNTIVSNRAGVTNINLNFGYLVEWDEMSPCGCYYPRNKIQMALVTDGCASYAIIGYVAVNWGSRDQAKAGYVHVLGNNRVETPESTAGTLATLVASQADQVWYFQGENVCTGKARDEFVVDPQNNNQYYVCGDCDIARTITCTSPQFYDPQCQKCVTRAFPNCDNPVNGGFSQWSNFGTCTKTCGDGQQEQRRTCTNPVPTNGGLSCQNNPAIIDKATSKLIPCNLRTCPQNGGYCSWTNGACNPTCGAGTLTQTRTCACPAPAFGGSDCSLLGPTTNIISCTNGPCPINGGFTAWQNIGGCTKTCGDDGLQRQERTCTNPVAQFGGLTCQENPLIVNKAIVQFIACGRGRCPDVCTNSNTQHNDFYVYPSQTRYCLCTRVDSNSMLTYIDDNVGCVDCPAGASWDPLIDSCSQIQQFQCLADPFCVGKTAGDYSIYHGFANESCSTQYYRCDASLQKQLFSCPINDAGAYFNPVTRTCSTGLAPASCANHECIGRTDGNKGRLDANCRSYLTCNSFLPTFPICPQGFYYDQGIRRCVEGGSRDNPPAGCIDPDCAGRPAGNYAVDNFCNAFYTCDANQRELSFTSCGSGEYYNPTLSGCSTSYPTGCQHKFCTERSNNVAGIFSFTGSSCSNSYVSCSGTSTAVPNLLTFSLSCPPNQYFRVSNSATSAGSCVNVDGNTPISPLCPNYQCIGRQNGYTFALSTTVAHDCRKYYICNDQQLSEQQCPTASPYYNPNTKTCDSVPSALCWHPDCISGTVPRDYAITANSQCFSSFYRCDANRQRSSQSCGLSFLGGYYGIDAVTNTWRCISGIAPSTCPNYLCIGRTGSASSVSTPMYRNPNDLYCTGYVSCSFSGVQSFLTCPNGGFLDYSGYQCVSARPLDQACRVDGGLSLWGAWQYVAGTSCSAACGNDGVQQMFRTRACNNPAPLNGGSTCGNAALTETKNDVCQTTPPPCGDQFCIGRAAGDYSRTLKDLVNSPNIACFNGYLRCSGAPLNTLEVRTCPSGSIWSPSSTSSNTGACITRPNTLDARCPVCAGIFSGSVPFSTLLTTYDCRSYYSCNNEAHSLVNCPQDTTTFGSNDPRPTYYNPNTKLCERIPVATCSPVQGYWSSWTYAASSSCSVDNNFQCSETQSRLCNSPSPVPSNDPNRQCPGLPTQRVPCRAGASGCGDAFCQSRIAGNYSKTLELSTPTNLGCYKEYITCSGPPSNTKTYEKCILNDQIYFPEKGRCFRDDPDPNCPNVGCAGKADGDHPFSNDLHDCRQFYTCLNEQPTLNTCPTDAQNRSSYYDGFFEKKCVNLPQDLVRRTCNYIQGWWSTWAPAQTCSRNGANQCVRSRTRSCNNPSPKNDPFPCGYSVANLRDESDTIACLESECAQPCQGITCPASSTCVNVGVSYQCQCNAGYQLISGNQLTVVCQDINECANSPYPCLSTQRCTNIQGSYQCLSAVCTANPNTCNDANAQCISTSQGSGYTCNCNTNLFTQSNGNQNNAVCTDINECLLPVNLYCGSSRVCLNGIGGFTCQAEQCNSERCGLNKLCTNINVQPGYACSCAPGFVTSLQNSNNCVLPCDNNPCQANSACANNGNSFTCTCNSGFKLVNNVCVDIDECTELGANGLPLHNCAAGTQVCVNTAGSFRCDSALQQCTVGRCSGANKVCQNIQTLPGYSCSCNTNFVPSVVANSIDCVLPCANNPCQANSACTNNGNSFICTCNSGYKEVNNVCVDIDECTELGANGSPLNTCASGTVCVNTIGSFRCDSANSCTGKQDGERFPLAGSNTQYIECDASGNSVTKSCPNGVISSFSLTLGSRSFGNGIWFSPVFLTCVNTTNNANPPATVAQSNGQWDLVDACKDISNSPDASGALVKETKLPLDFGVGVDPCQKWLLCKDGDLLKKEEVIPEAGDCSTNEQGYDRDQRICDELNNKCPIKN